MEEAILEYLHSEYPNEGCGIVLNKKGTLEWVPCKNVSPEPSKHFKICPKEYVSATLRGDIHTIVHSHVNGSCKPSQFDIEQSTHLQVPYTIYSIPEREKYVYTPEYKVVPLLGRQYEFGKQDCWTLVRDYYKQNYNSDLPMLEFEEDFHNKGINYFEDLIEAWEGTIVTSPEIGDIIYFKINSDIPNHCGIYTGNDTFIHARTKHLSCTDFLPRWQKYIVRYIRCKKFT